MPGGKMSVDANSAVNLYKKSAEYNTAVTAENLNSGNENISVFNNSNQDQGNTSDNQKSNKTATKPFDFMEGNDPNNSDGNIEYSELSNLYLTADMLGSQDYSVDGKYTLDELADATYYLS